jgi:hypothetical protein
MPSYLGETTFIEAISCGWGLAIRCCACQHEHRWTDQALAEKFIDRLDDQVSSIAKRLKCTEPGCGARDTILSFYHAGSFDGAVCETPASIEGRAKKLREMAAAKAGPSSYAGAKMRS